MNEVWLVGELCVLLAPIGAVAVATWVRSSRRGLALAAGAVALSLVGPQLALHGGDQLDLTGSLTAALQLVGGLLLSTLGTLCAAAAADAAHGLRALPVTARLVGALWAAEAVCVALYLGVLAALTPANAAAWGVWPTVAYALATFFAMPLFVGAASGGPLVAAWRSQA